VSLDICEGMMMMMMATMAVDLRQNWLCLMRLNMKCMGTLHWVKDLKPKRPVPGGLDHL
jgi:hypothetical protein